MSNENVIKRLLELASIYDQVSTIQPLYYGGNNQLYLINRKYVAKKYFKHELDQRDRFGHELKFMRYASKVAPEFIPLLYSVEPEAGWTLFEFIDGQTLDGHRVEEAWITRAAHFFFTLNQEGNTAQIEKLALPLASEACFSIKDHIDLVAVRVLNLENKLAEDRLGNVVLDQYLKNLSEKLFFLKDKIERCSKECNLYDEMLPVKERCVSPSDFGFHNAIINNVGEIKFLDFEYAGIDDPAKMVADFFSQVAIPVDDRFLSIFMERALKGFEYPQKIALRVEWLLPLYRLKWSCIVMNAFDPVQMARRKFSDPSLDEENYKSAKLTQALSLLETIK